MKTNRMFVIWETDITFVLTTCQTQRLDTSISLFNVLSCLPDTFPAVLGCLELNNVMHDEDRGGCECWKLRSVLISLDSKYIWLRY